VKDFDIQYLNHLLYFVPVMLQLKRVDDPVVFLKEDYTVLQNILLGAIECKCIFHFMEKCDKRLSVVLIYVLHPSNKKMLAVSFHLS